MVEDLMNYNDEILTGHNHTGMNGGHCIFANSIAF